MTLDAEILAIGDELVDGQGLDTNSRYLAEQLALLGLEVQRFTVVRDHEPSLTTAIAEACSRSDVVIATGGLGPTEDDRTRNAAAAAAGTKLVFHDPSWEHIQELFKSRGRPVDESNRRQAWLPAAAQVIPNRWGTAPGFQMAIHKATFYSLPGVPREMRKMFAAGVVESLRQHLPKDTTPLHFHNLYVLGCTEASLNQRIHEFMAGDQEHDTRVGITASWGLLTVRLAAATEAAAKATADRIRPKLGSLLVCEGGDSDSFVSQVGQELIDKHITCAVAESCTGGLLAAALTDVPDISRVFLAGFVTYSNEAKERDLGVATGLLERQGAVSVEVAKAMAEGVVARTGAHLGMAITGIAGPGGGTEDKPVGTVCFGLAVDGNVTAHECRFGNLGREFIRRRSVWEALATMHRALENTSSP